MRTLAADFITEKDRAWARPFNSAVFHFGGAVGDIYVAGRDITIGGNAHKGCVARWGEFRSLIAPRDGTFQINSLTLEIINLPIFGAPAKRFTDLWAGIGIEGVEVDVYQNFRQVGSATILQEPLFAGVVRPREYTPTVCLIETVNISEKYLDSREISFPIDDTDFPLADRDDVGKRANVIYGAVKKAIAHAVRAGLQSILRATIGTGDNFVPIHEDFFDLLPSAGLIQIGNEQITYTGKTAVPDHRLTGAARGANSTPVESHLKNDTIIQILTEYLYLAAGHQMASIDRVYVKRGSKVVPLAASQYTVDLTNVGLVAGQTLSVISFSAPPLVAEKDFVGLIDGIGVDDTIGINQQNSESTYAESANGATLQVSAGQLAIVHIADFGFQDKVKSSGQFKVSIPWSIPPTTEGGLQLGVSMTGINFGANLYETNSNGQVVTQAPSPFVFLSDVFPNPPQVSNPPELRIGLVKTNGIPGSTVSITIGLMTIEYLVSQAVTKSGTVTKTGTVTLSNTSTAELVIGDAVLFDGQGYKDDGSGTYTGDAGALIEKPADVLHHLARVPGQIPASRVDAAAFVAARTDAPASYKLAGVVTDRSSNLRALMLALGMQARIKIDWPVDKLSAQFRKSVYPAAIKTITQEEIMEDGGRRTTLRVKRTPVEDLINVIHLYYGRDWSAPRSRNSFNKVSKATDAASIAAFGQREHADRFLFDFIAETNSAMADDLRDFYIALYREPARLISFDCKLDQYELLPGDVIGINFYARLGSLSAGGFPYTFPFVVNTETPGEQFDGLNGTQKFLIEEIRHIAGARHQSATRMGLTVREVL